MSYILKNDLTMGGQYAINENIDYMTDEVMQRIDEIANGDITRAHVETAVNEEKQDRKKFPLSRQYENRPA